MSKRTTVHAYYYSFELTGVEHIDAILRLVARAGQGSPNTEFWDDPTVLEEGEPTYVERIQNAADKAAAAWRKTEAIARRKAEWMTNDDLVALIKVLLRGRDDWELAAIYLYARDGNAPGTDEIQAIVDEMETS